MYAPRPSLNTDVEAGQYRQVRRNSTIDRPVSARYVVLRRNVCHAYRPADRTKSIVDRLTDIRLDIPASILEERECRRCRWAEGFKGPCSLQSQRYVRVVEQRHDPRETE